MSDIELNNDQSEIVVSSSVPLVSVNDSPPNNIEVSEDGSIVEITQGASDQIEILNKNNIVELQSPPVLDT